LRTHLYNFTDKTHI